MKLDYTTMIHARFKRDRTFDGKFFVGIISTRIFCLPSCKARFSHEKNMIFFQDKNEALNAGFRGCKRCNSVFYPNMMPSWLLKIKKYLDDNLDKKITEKDLEVLISLEITTIRRYFKRFFGITPNLYHLKLRLSHANDLIKEGESVRKVLYQTGFKSLNGFRNAYLKEFGLTPISQGIF